MRRFLASLTALALVGAAVPAVAATFSVLPGGGSNCNSGPCDLQSALDTAATNGEDNVLNLAPSLFSASAGTFTYEPAVQAGSLTLQGDPGGGTVLDGAGVQVMRIDTLHSSTDTLSDISVSDITFQGGVGADNAGGLAIISNDASSRVDRCKFLQNVNLNSSSPLFPNFGGGGLSILAVNSGSIAVTNSEFRSNGVSSDGGGTFLLSTLGDVLVQGNAFIENSAGTSRVGGSAISTGGFNGAGGAFSLSVFGHLTVDRNYFSRNFSETAAGGLLGLAIEGSGVVTNNIFDQNSADNVSGLRASTGGAGMVLVTTKGSFAIGNNTVSGNRMAGADAGGLLLFVGDNASSVAQADIYNNIFFDNAATGGVQCTTSCNDIFVMDALDVLAPSPVGSTVNVFNNIYSDIAFSCDPALGCEAHQNVDVTTNFNANPLFANAGIGDFHLLPESPAIDAGTAFAPVITAVDFDGNPRNQGQTVDMGALEFPQSPTENCANGDDDDDDGRIDCLDPDCSGAAACLDSSTPQPSGTENCANDVDDNGNDQIDCQDAACSGAAICRGDAGGGGSGSTENCANNVDDNGNGLIDCNDPGCGAASACQQLQEVTVNSSGCSLAVRSGASANSYGLLSLLWIVGCLALTRLLHTLSPAAGRNARSASRRSGPGRRSS